MSDLALSSADVQAIASAVIAEQKRAQLEAADDLALRAVATLLTSFGIEEGDRVEIKADFIHLRKWRKSVEAAGTITFKLAVTAIFGGLLGALWLGLKATIGK